MAPSLHEITQLLQAWSNGDQSALDQLMPLVYDDLHRLAQRRMAGERDDHTLQTTALVNEAYMRLVDSKQATWKDRAHFFAVCARLMRHILVDAARSRRAIKRGADVTVVELDEAIAAPAEPVVDLVFYFHPVGTKRKPTRWQDPPRVEPYMSVADPLHSPPPAGACSRTQMGI
jgi:RNA polymerase sigma factor (TIGR02999 family)